MKTPPMPDLLAVRAYLEALQEALIEAFSSFEPLQTFQKDVWTRPEGGGGMSAVLRTGKVFESAGVNFSHVQGAALPASATVQRPLLVGRAFEAMGVSVVIHPLNPFVPTTHMNLRFFCAHHPSDPPLWWFGGGYDLTPYYGFKEDAMHWHRTAKEACTPFGQEIYPKYKAWCDRYFYLPHREEARGIGGIFFDDLNEGGFTRCFAFIQAVGGSFLKAYAPLVHKRQCLAFGEKEQSFQRYRRGRYVEFNLVYDRGTLFGLQTGGRTESILMSLPPRVEWRYHFKPQVGTREWELTDYFLKPRDWTVDTGPKIDTMAPAL